MNKEKSFLKLLLLLSAVLLIFSADLEFPLGMIVGIAYLSILFIASKILSDPQYYFIVTLISLSLLIAPIVSGDPLTSQVIMNRLISFLLLCFFSYLLIKNSRTNSALQESKEQYRTIVDTSFEGILVTDSKESIILSNKKISEILDTSETELNGKPVSEIINISGFPADGEKEISIQKKDGTDILVSVSLKRIPVLYKNIYIIRDLSAEKQRESELEESQARLSGMVASAMDAIITINRSQEIILFNKAAEDMFGYEQHETLGKHIGLLIPTDVRNLHVKYVENFGKTGITNRHMGALGAVKGLKKDGTEFPIEASISQLNTHGRKYYTVILRDITERKIAEQNLLESENRFRNMADNAPVLIWLADEEGSFSYLNRSWLDFTGKSLEEQTGFKWIEAVHPDDKDSVLLSYKNAVEKKESFILECRIKKYDGSYRWIINHGIPRVSPGMQYTGFIGSCTDITERKLFEEQINTSLKEKEILLKEVHHRVKNNLQVISSLLNLQSDYSRDEAFADLILESQNRIKSMALIHEKLYQSKALSAVEADTYINDLVKKVISTYKSDNETITLELEVEPVPLDIDRGISIGLIINELISNCMKYAFPPGFPGEKKLSVIFSKELNTGKLKLLVKDTGIGMPEEFNPEDSDSLGYQLIYTLTSQIDGTIKLSINEGTSVEILF